MSIEIKNQKTEQFIHQWRYLNQRENEALLEKKALLDEKKALYQNLSYWDRFASSLPSFIGKFAGIDLEKIIAYQNYFEKLENISRFIDNHHEDKESVIQKMFFEIISKADSIDISVCKQLLREIEELESFASSTLLILKEAEEMEASDGDTSDETFWGVVNKNASRDLNIKAAHMLCDLNNSIKIYNLNLLDKNFQSKLFFLQEIFQIGEELISAELSEDDPFNFLMGDFGDWLSSKRTLRVIHEALFKVENLLKEINTQKREIKLILSHFVKNELEKVDETFIHEIGSINLK